MCKAQGIGYDVKVKPPINTTAVLWIQSKCIYMQLLLMFQERKGTVFVLHDSKDRKSLGMLWVPIKNRQKL